MTATLGHHQTRSLTTGVTHWVHRDPTSFKCKTSYSSGPYSTPTTDGDRVYTLGAEGRLNAIRLTDGSTIWTRDLLVEFGAPTEQFPVGSSPLLDGGRLFVSIGGQPESGIVALDPATGHTIWSATDDRRGFATPVAATIHGRPLLFVLTGEALVCLDPKSGVVHWRIPYRAKNRDVVTATTPIVCGDLIFVSAYQVPTLCVRVLADGQFESVWSKHRSLDSQHNNLICRDGSVVGFSAREHCLGCVDLQTGEWKWKWKWKSELDRGMLPTAAHLLVGRQKIICEPVCEPRRLTMQRNDGQNRRRVRTRIRHMTHLATRTITERDSLGGFAYQPANSLPAHPLRL